MALEGRNISGGMNSGAAQVYSQTQNAVNVYARTIQQQQAKRQAEDKLLYDEMSKVKVDGVRQADLPEFNTKYNQWKDSFSKLQGERDNGKKMLLRRDFDRSQIELQELVADSKAIGERDKGFGTMLLDPNKRDGFMPDAVDKFSLSTTLSRNDPRFIRNLMGLEHQVDISGVSKLFDDADKKLLDYSQWDDPKQTPYKRGNEEGVMSQTSKTINPQQQAIVYGAMIDTDDGKIRTALRKMFPQYAELPLAEFKAAVIPELVNQRVKTEYGEPKFEGNKKPDNWMEKALFNDRLVRARKSSDDAADESTYRQQLVGGIMNNDKSSLDELQAYLPSGSKVTYHTSGKVEKGKIVTVDGKRTQAENSSKGGYNFVRINIPAVYGGEAGNTIISPAIDEDISLSKGDAKNRINAILSLHTGDKVNMSKFNIEGGKPRGKQIEIQGQSKQSTPQGSKPQQATKSTKPDVIQNGNTFRWDGTKYVYVK